MKPSCGKYCYLLERSDLVLICFPLELVWYNEYEKVKYYDGVNEGFAEELLQLFEFHYCFCVIYKKTLLFSKSKNGFAKKLIIFQ